MLGKRKYDPEDDKYLADKFKEIEGLFEYYNAPPKEDNPSKCPNCGADELKERARVEPANEGGVYVTPFVYCTNCAYYKRGIKAWRDKY